MADNASTDEDHNVFYNQDHKVELEKGVAQLLTSGNYADVTLSVRHRRFACHKAILSIASPYFDVLFSGAFVESGKDEMVLHEIDPDIFGAVLRYVYSGEISLKLSDLEAVFEVANMLQLESLCAKCADVLEARMTSVNAFRIYRLAEKTSYVSLLEKAKAFVLKNFMESLSFWGGQHDFQQLTGDSICELLENDELNIPTEEDACLAVLNWLEYSPEERLEYMEDILLRLRLTHVDKSFFIDHLIKNEILLKNQNCFNVLMSINSANPSVSLHNLYSYAARNSYGESCLITFCYDEPFIRMQPLGLKRTDLKRPGLLYCERSPNCRPYPVCVIDNDLITGGMLSSKSDILRYHSREDIWRRCGRLNVERTDCGAVIANGKVYFVGGRDPSISKNVLKEVEELNLADGICKVVIEMSSGVSNAACIAYNNVIYIIAGYSDYGQPTKYIYKYDLEKQMCIVHTFLPKPLGSCQALRYRHYGIIMARNACLVLDMKRQILMDRPTFALNLTNFGCFSHNGQLYVVGGLKHKDEYNRRFFPSGRSGNQLSPAIQRMKLDNIIENKSSVWERVASLQSEAQVWTCCALSMSKASAYN